MRISRSRRWASAVALAVSVSMVPTVAVAGGASGGLWIAPARTGVAAAVPGVQAQALLMAKKKKKKKKKKPSGGLTPESAETKRQAIRDAVAGDVEAKKWGSAADETESNAALLGDPVSYQQAAEYRLEQAEADRDVDAANAAIETATVALDIYHFYDAVDSGDAVSEWLVIAPAEASSGISETEGIISRAEKLIEEIEAEQESGDSGEAGTTDDGKKKKKKKQRGKAKPGTVFIAVGAALTAVGVGGASAGIAGLVISGQKQKEVEGLTLPDDQMRVDELDEEGAAANRLALIGAIIGGVGLAAGVPLIVVGAIRRKKAGGASETARIQVAPVLSSRFSGLAVHGRF